MIVKIIFDLLVTHFGQIDIVAPDRNRMFVKDAQPSDGEDQPGDSGGG